MDSADQFGSSRRRRSDLVEEEEIEEGEFVAGSDTDRRYVFHRHRVQDEGRPQIKRPRFASLATIDGDALPSPTPSCECDSDGTISDTDADDAGAVAALAQELLFRCPVCQRSFQNQKAVCGHMRVHDPHRRQQRNTERPLVFPLPAISGGWAVTGKRGSVGGRSVSPESEGVVDSNSMAIVVSEPVIDPMPISFAIRSSSVEPKPNPPNDDSMAIVVASSDKPATNHDVVHPPRPSTPQFHEGHLQHAAPQVAIDHPQPAFLTQCQLAAAAAAAPPQIVTSLQLAAHQVQRAAPPPTRDEEGWWVCKEKGCDKRYATHQGLGGHMAGHKNRENSEAAAAGLHLGVGGVSCAKPAKLHPCKHCPKVFTSGVQLGGHMRKHYEGRVIPKKRGPRANVSAGELASALALSTLPMPMPPAAVEAAAPVAEVAAPAVPGVVRIFGFNVVVPPAAAAAEEVSSAVTAPPAAATAEEVSSAVTATPAAAAAEEVSSAVTAPPAAATAEEVSSAVTATPAAAAAEEVSSAVAAPPADAAAEEVSSAVAAPPAAAAEEVSSAVTAPPATAAAEEVSSGVTETDRSSAASTNNVQAVQT